MDASGLQILTHLPPVRLDGLVRDEILRREERLQHWRLIERLEADKVLNGVEQVVDDDGVLLGLGQDLVQLCFRVLLVRRDRLAISEMFLGKYFFVQFCQFHFL